MRYLVVSMFVHVLVLSLIWVGFSIPAPQVGSLFFYLGEEMTSLPLGLENGVKVDQGKVVDSLVVDEPSSAFFKPWIKMRELNKPR